MMRCAVMGPSQSGKTHLISRMSKFHINDTMIIGAELILSSITINETNYEISFFDTSGTVRFLDVIKPFNETITMTFTKN